MQEATRHLTDAMAWIDALPTPVRLGEAYLEPEPAVVNRLLGELDRHSVNASDTAGFAAALAEDARARSRSHIGIDTFLHEYSLSSDEGVALMCLAESLIRVPDDTTALELVEDRLLRGDWENHMGRSESFLVNASTWGLLLTGRLFELDGASFIGTLKRLAGRLGREIALKAIRQAMVFVGRQFVISESIEDALRTVGPYRPTPDGMPDPRYSFDMLGEAALSEADAEGYFASYRNAIEALGRHYRDTPPGVAAVSVKLSALEPRFEPFQAGAIRRRLVARVMELVEVARALDIQVTIDAEEAHRHHLTLTVFHDVLTAGAARGWSGLGLAVQAYQKRALPTLDWLTELAQRHHTQIPVRLVKGAYWDTEIKRAQQLGLADYPVFVRKQATDVSFLACAQRMLASQGTLYGQFATHNAHTLASVVAFAQQHGTTEFEVQRLFGMGEALSEALSERRPDVPQRIYAPVGPYRALLPYLMRRLLENGANSSFVHHLSDERVPLAELIRDPVAELTHDDVPADVVLPPLLYGAERVNAKGLNLDDPAVLRSTLAAIRDALAHGYDAAPLVSGATALDLPSTPVVSPADTSHRLGSVRFATPLVASAALDAAHAAFDGWRTAPATERANLLDAWSENLEHDTDALLALLTSEAGRTLAAAHAEIREAVDFCRYYAALARRDLAMPVRLPGPTGELNRWTLEGRGVFLAISPWNFPLSILVGQIAAALVAGNAVIAKPSEQTNLIAHRAIVLAHGAGIPPGVLHLLHGTGDVAALLLADARLGGVVFTGSTHTARHIARALADREGPFVTLIAETGGINAMIVDSSAQPEQVVRDVLLSAFESAGQRCSSLRVLFLQRDVADDILSQLRGALAVQRVGHPCAVTTDVPPVINPRAQRDIDAYVASFPAAAVFRPQQALPATGYFVDPAIVELPVLAMPDREVFGPVLHTVRFEADELDRVVDLIRRTGYALTLGLHSRIEGRAEEIARTLPVGNFYVNRSIVGATVETQPFGGFGLSGLGPKAGGPRYLRAFCVERTVTINTAAVGGDTELLARGS